MFGALKRLLGVEESPQAQAPQYPQPQRPQPRPQNLQVQQAQPNTQIQVPQPYRESSPVNLQDLYQTGLERTQGFYTPMMPKYPELKHQEREYAKYL